MNLALKICTGILICAAVTIWWALRDLPNPQSLKGCVRVSMSGATLCPGADNYVRIQNVSPLLVSAIIISEDAGFFGHQGIDWHELRESLEKNLETGRYARGGSTITQQLIKNVYFSSEKSLIRKIKEAYLSVQVEELLSKTQILERYLNAIEFGPRVWGIVAASEFYFFKRPSELNLLESVFLAQVLPNPETYSRGLLSGTVSAGTRERMKKLLAKLKRFKKITLQEHEQALIDLVHFPRTVQSLESPESCIDEEKCQKEEISETDES